MKKIKKNRLIFVRDDGIDRLADADEFDDLPPSGARIGKRKMKPLFSVLIFIVIAAGVAFGIFYYLKGGEISAPEKVKPRLGKSEVKDLPESRTVSKIKTQNIHLEKGLKSYHRGYYNDALSEFEEVVLSGAPDNDKAVALTYSGIIYDDRSEYDRAVEYFKRALKYDENNVITYRNLSIAYRHKGDLDNALEAIEEGIDLDEENVNNQLLLGNILFELGKYEKAIDQFRNVLDMSPDNPTALYNLAQSYFNEGDEVQGIEYLKKAGSGDRTGEIAHLAYSKLGVIYTQRKDFELAEKYLSLAVSIAPDDPVDRYNLGLIYLKTGKEQKALESFHKAEELGYKDSLLLENIGEAYFSLREYDRSIETYNKILEINKRNIRVLSRMAEIYYKNGELEQAYRFYKKITVLEPVSENARVAYLNMGNILDEAQRYDEAIDAYKKALAIDPADSSALYNLGIAYKHSGKGELAIETWRKAAELEPDDPANLMAIGDYYYEKGLYDYALDEYGRVVRRRPDIQDAHFNVAAIYYKKNLLDYALDEYREVIEINNRNDLARKAYINIGLILSRKKESSEDVMEEAFSSIQKALLLKPGDPGALSALGAVYIAQGNTEKAIDTLYQAVSASDDSKLIAESYNYIGQCYYRQGQYKKALQAFTRGIEAEPTYEEIRINRKVAMQAYERELER